MALKFKKKIFEKDLSSGHGAVFIAEEDGDFIGYVFVLDCAPGVEKMRKYYPGYINDLYVCKKFRRNNIAIKLIKEAEKWAKKKGKDAISLDVEFYNAGAIELYRKMKFRDKFVKLEKKLK